MFTYENDAPSVRWRLRLSTERLQNCLPGRVTLDYSRFRVPRSRYQWYSMRAYVRYHGIITSGNHSVLDSLCEVTGSPNCFSLIRFQGTSVIKAVSVFTSSLSYSRSRRIKDSFYRCATPGRTHLQGFVDHPNLGQTLISRSTPFTRKRVEFHQKKRLRPRFARGNGRKTPNYLA